MNTVLQVWHNRAFKMVGKVLTHHGVRTFYHEESGTQRHYAFNSPGGIDLVVLDWLEQHGVGVVHHSRRGQLLTATVALIREYGAFQESDDRMRMYLSHDLWQPGEPYVTPWIEEIVRL